MGSKTKDSGGKGGLHRINHVIESLQNIEYMIKANSARKIAGNF